MKSGPIYLLSKNTIENTMQIGHRAGMRWFFVHECPGRTAFGAVPEVKKMMENTL